MWTAPILGSPNDRVEGGIEPRKRVQRNRRISRWRGMTWRGFRREWRRGTEENPSLLGGKVQKYAKIRVYRVSLYDYRVPLWCTGRNTMKSVRVLSVSASWVNAENYPPRIDSRVLRRHWNTLAKCPKTERFVCFVLFFFPSSFLFFISYSNGQTIRADVFLPFSWPRDTADKPHRFPRWLYCNNTTAKWTEKTNSNAGTVLDCDVGHNWRDFLTFQRLLNIRVSLIIHIVAIYGVCKNNDWVLKVLKSDLKDTEYERKSAWLKQPI